MNVDAIFTNRTAPRTEPAARRDGASRTDDIQQADDAEPRKVRKPSQAEFSALLALLAGAGPQVRAELLTQVPSARASLIDSLLEGEPASPQDASDALRYGILMESGPSVGSTDRRPLTSIGTRSGDHAQEVLSRIASRHAATADQLKARGDNEAADLRIALDAILAHAGTPAGLELAAAAESAAITAAAAALTSAKAASGADVTTPVRDTRALTTDLQQRLDRVITRMKNEFGHDVHVVETARSQERQDYLYEQGRTRPGAVVTWTRDSAHSQGTAVDVRVDGSWNNPEGFARLQRIAREEGLRTLGARDPGHLELESSVSSGGQDMAAARDTTSPRAAAPVAASAMRAGVAQVAGVASVAQIAAPGASRGNSRAERAIAMPAAAGEVAAASAGTIAASAGRQGSAFGRDAQDANGRPLHDGRRLGAEHRAALEPVVTPAFGALQGTAPSTTASTMETAAPAGIGSAERVADAQALRDSAPAGSVSRLTLNIDAADGGQDRITVDVRGNSVGADIRTDAASADRLRMRTAELQDALGRHGLESERVRVSGVARTETTEGARVAAGERDTVRLGATQNAGTNDHLSNQGQRDRAANAREWDRPDASQRDRDEERESARQGAGQRDSRETPYRSAR